MWIVLLILVVIMIFLANLWWGLAVGAYIALYGIINFSLGMLIEADSQKDV